MNLAVKMFFPAKFKASDPMHISHDFQRRKANWVPWPQRENTKMSLKAEIGFTLTVKVKEIPRRT